jgi:DeoR/GlpR family transcriptional regulator of sugar metabolism
MNKHERLTEILDYLKSHKKLSVEEACVIFNNSAATIRRDFSYLFKRKKVEKIWGGIAQLHDVSLEESLIDSSEKNIENLEAKISIARYTASLIKDGDVVILDGGTTTLQLIPFLKNKKIRIITNSLLIAQRIDQISEGFDFELFVTGGFVYPRSGMLVGAQVSNSIKDFYSNWFIMSAGGISNDGFFNSNSLVVDTEKEMIKRCEKFVVLADCTKIGKRDSVKLCDLKTPEMVITDKGFLNLDQKIKDLLTNIECLHIAK